MRFDEESPLIARAVDLFEMTMAASNPDIFAYEHALFNLMFEYERTLHHALYPGRPA